MEVLFGLFMVLVFIGVFLLNVPWGPSDFNDTLKVYTAPSGTQYVLPTDVLLTEEHKARLNEYLQELRKQNETPLARS